MIESKKFDVLETSNVRLSVVVSAEHVQQRYNSVVKEYSKKVQIPGFRKGKVPSAVLENKFGDGFKQEACQKIITESVEKIFEDKDLEYKPLTFTPPSLESIPTLRIGEPLAFSVIYDIYPQIDLQITSGFTIEEPQVHIDKKTIDRELLTLQERNAITIEKSAGKVEEGDIVEYSTFELDDKGGKIASSEKPTSTLAKVEDLQKLGIPLAIIGLELNSETVLEFPKDATNESTTETESKETEQPESRKLLVQIRKIRERQLPAIDDELAQDINEEFKTIDDLKKHLQNKLKIQKNSLLEQYRNKELLNKIAEANPMVLPESMIMAELQEKWHKFTHQFGMSQENSEYLFLHRDANTNTLLEKWRPEAIESIKQQLIIRNLIDTLNIEISEEELQAEYQKQSDINNISVEQMQKYYEDKNMKEYIEHIAQTKKVIDHLFTSTKIKKGERITFVEFMQKYGYN